MTEALLTFAAPIFEVDGEVHDELTRDIQRLEIEETTAGLRTLSACWVAQGATPDSSEQRLLYLDGAILDFGKKISVTLGAAPSACRVFSGWISALEVSHQEAHEPEVVAFAEDGLMKLRMTRRMKTYTDVTDADIVAAIASEHGLTPATDADGPSHDVVQQWNQSDLAFLRERAARIQAEIWIDDTTLNFKSRDRRSGTELTLVAGNHLIALRARADLAHQRTRIHVSGYDASTRDTIDEGAGPDAIQAEIESGRSGPEILQRAFGERVSYRVREAALKSGEASAWARAEMLRRARRFVVVSGTTRGSAEMVVGSKVTLDRTGAPFDGPGYYVTRIRHTYDLVNGLRTHFDAERPTLQEGA